MVADKFKKRVTSVRRRWWHHLIFMYCQLKCVVYVRIAMQRSHPVR